MPNYLASNLRFLRKAKGITQQDIANQLGKSQGSYAGWENGSAEPGIDSIIKISDILSVPIDDLFRLDLSKGNLNANLESGKKGNLKGNPKGNLSSRIETVGDAFTDIKSEIHSLSEKLDNIIKIRQEEARRWLNERGE